MIFRSQLRAAFAVCIVWMLSTAIVAQQPQPTATGSIHGIVRHARTGEPIVGARVTLSAAPANPPRETVPPMATATSNGNGEFVLADLAAGAYRFNVMNNGFVRHDSRRIELVAGEAVKDVVVRLTPTGAVSGRVHGTSGQPLVGATVSLLRRAYSSNGAIIYSAAGSAKTNDLGEYRMFWVTPGRYYVTAEGTTHSMLDDDRYTFDDSVRRGLNEVGASYTQTFFPGVTDISKAAMIDLQEAGELRGIDLTLARQQLFTIRGRLVDTATGLHPAQANVYLSQRYPNGAFSSSSGARTYDPATGTFELPNLPPGRYGVSVRDSGAGIGNLTAATEVIIGDAGVENLVLSIATQPVITGSIKVEGPLPTGTSVERLRINLTSTTPSFFSSSATARVDGTFSMNTVAEGHFRVIMPALPAGFYLKEARLNGADVLRTPSRFSSSASLELTITSQAGQIEGRVVDEQMKPVAGVEAILVPNDGPDYPELFKRATTDREGRFSIPSITPGDYRIFSWERLEANFFFDPEVLKRYETRGTPVRVAESSRQAVEMKLIPEGVSP